jgi:hypothetical protein
MTRLGKLFTILSVCALVAILVGVAYTGRAAETPEAAEVSTLAIEIPMKNGPFTVPAAWPRTTVSAHVPVPSALPGQVSAVRLMPRLVDDKVQVKVYALYGDVSKVTSCEEWNQLKSSYLGEYTAANGEEFALKELSSLGVSFSEKPLTVRVVPMKVKPRVVQTDPIIVTACQCAGCGGLSCCPDNGKCIRCGDCGSACCTINET